MHAPGGGGGKGMEVSDALQSGFINTQRKAEVMCANRCTNCPCQAVLSNIAMCDNPLQISHLQYIGWTVKSQHLLYAGLIIKSQHGFSVVADHPVL